MRMLLRERFLNWRRTKSEGSDLGIEDDEQCFTTQFSSVTQAYPTLCDPHGPQHTRLPCPSPTLGVCSNSCPSSW